MQRELGENSQSAQILTRIDLTPTFHTHTTMLDAQPTIFCFRVLGLLSSFGFLQIDLTAKFHTHTTMLNAHTTRIFVSEFRVCCWFLGFIDWSHSNIPTWFFVSQFWVSFRILVYCRVCFSGNFYLVVPLKMS